MSQTCKLDAGSEASLSLSPCSGTATPLPAHTSTLHDFIQNNLLSASQTMDHMNPPLNYVTATTILSGRFTIDQIWVIQKAQETQDHWHDYKSQEILSSGKLSAYSVHHVVQHEATPRTYISHLPLLALSEHAEMILYLDYYVCAEAVEEVEVWGAHRKTGVQEGWSSQKVDNV